MANICICAAVDFASDLANDQNRINFIHCLVNLWLVLVGCILRLNSSDQDGEPMYIQMVTALVLQLIQCVVHLPTDKDCFDEIDCKVIVTSVPEL